MCPIRPQEDPTLESNSTSEVNNLVNGKLAKASNLADVPDKAVGLSNLGVYSTSQVNTLLAGKSDVGHTHSAVVNFPCFYNWLGDQSAIVITVYKLTAETLNLGSVTSGDIMLINGFGSASVWSSSPDFPITGPFIRPLAGSTAQIVFDGTHMDGNSSHHKTMTPVNPTNHSWSSYSPRVAVVTQSGTLIMCVEADTSVTLAGRRWDRGISWISVMFLKKQ